MKLLAAGAIAAIAIAGLPVAAHAATPAADDTTIPTITGISLAVQDATISGNSQCVDIPIAVSYVTNGDFVYQIDVYATHGTLPSDTTETSTKLTAPGTTANATVSGTLTYCASTQGIGKLDAGPSIIHYATPSEVGQSTVTDPATAPFDVQQASTAKLTGSRHHKNVTLHASETYFDYVNSAIHRTTSQVAYLQFLNVKTQKYVTVAKKQPSASKGSATFKFKTKRQLNYRAVFADSATIAASISPIITK